MWTLRSHDPRGSHSVQHIPTRTSPSLVRGSEGRVNETVLDVDVSRRGSTSTSVPVEVVSYVYFTFLVPGLLVYETLETGLEDWKPVNPILETVKLKAVRTKKFGLRVLHWSQGECGPWRDKGSETDENQDRGLGRDVCG